MKRQDRLQVSETITFNPDGPRNRKNFLQHIIETRGFTTMIEVGVRDGRTTFWLLDHIADLTIIGIDTNTDQFYTTEVASKYAHRLQPIQGVSYLVADQIPDQSVDLVFIDADHSYEAVKQDIIKFAPKVKPNGVLCGHDIDYPGVNRAVKELIPDFDVGPNFVWIKKG